MYYNPHLNCLAVVYDGRRYDITQRRMLDWDADKDPSTSIDRLNASP